MPPGRLGLTGTGSRGATAANSQGRQGHWLSGADSESLGFAGAPRPRATPPRATGRSRLGRPGHWPDTAGPPGRPGPPAGARAVWPALVTTFVCAPGLRIHTGARQGRGILWGPGEGLRECYQEPGKEKWLKSASLTDDRPPARVTKGRRPADSKCDQEKMVGLGAIACPPQAATPRRCRLQRRPATGTHCPPPPPPAHLTSH